MRGQTGKGDVVMKKYAIDTSWRNSLIVGLIGALSLVLTGCWLRATGGFVFTDDISTYVYLEIDNVSAALCLDEEVDGITYKNCQYNIETVDGSSQGTSTFKLV